MTRRQRIPRQWLIIDRPTDRQTLASLRRLPSGSGILLLQRETSTAHRQLRRLAKARDLTVVLEATRVAARVHSLRELRHALCQRTLLIYLSPIHQTSSHPDWRPLPRMRAATYARLGNRKLLALGGMNAERYSKIEKLGFVGWAGISAFRT